MQFWKRNNMWYQKRIAIIDDTDEQHQVITSLSDFDERLYPTLFFNYFNTAPVHNAMTQCLNILDLKKFIQDDDGLLQEEEKG